MTKKTKTAGRREADIWLLRLRSSPPPRRLRSFTEKDEEARQAQWRREWCGLPGPMDRWVAPAVYVKPEEAGFAAKKVDEHMARCLLTIECTKGLDDPMFSNPDKWTLYGVAVLSANVFPNAKDCISPRVAIDSYEGQSKENEITSPDWLLKWSTEETRELWSHRGHVAKVFARLAMEARNLTEPGLSARIVEWATSAAHDAKDYDTSMIIL